MLPVVALIALGALPLSGQAGSDGAWVAPARRAQRANPISPIPEVLAEGRKLYENQCAPCHGAAGNNDGPAAGKIMANARRPSDPALWAESDGALFWKIGEGRKPMPSTWGVLDDEQRWALVLYLRTLAPKPSS